MGVTAFAEISLPVVSSDARSTTISPVRPAQSGNLSGGFVTTGLPGKRFVVSEAKSSVIVVLARHLGIFAIKRMVS